MNPINDFGAYSEGTFTNRVEKCNVLTRCPLNIPLMLITDVQFHQTIQLTTTSPSDTTTTITSSHTNLTYSSIHLLKPHNPFPLFHSSNPYLSSRKNLHHNHTTSAHPIPTIHPFSYTQTQLSHPPPAPPPPRLLHVQEIPPPTHKLPFLPTFYCIKTYLLPSHKPRRLVPQ